MLKSNNEHCNAEAMLRVRSFILAAPDREFDMRSYCGTARCIAGWAVEGNDIETGDEQHSMTPYLAAKNLGLDMDQAVALFLVQADDHDYTFKTGLLPLGLGHVISREHAAQAIDNVIADGMPHWDKILGDTFANAEWYTRTDGRVVRVLGA